MSSYFCCVVREVAENPGPDEPSHIEVVDLFVIDSFTAVQNFVFNMTFKTLPNSRAGPSLRAVSESQIRPTHPSI